MSPYTPEPMSCLVCGVESPDVVMALVEWRGVERPYDFIPRCRDRQACRTRLEGFTPPANEWPVNDSQTHPTRRAVA